MYVIHVTTIIDYLARERLNNFFDDNEWNEKFKGIQPTDFLDLTLRKVFRQNKTNV